MSGEQLASSFGEAAAANAQPPTPKQSPTSAVFPSPVFQTPKNSQGRFEESGGWTPRFAEEYSVFNNTPGNLGVSQGSFVDLAPVTPYQSSSSAGQKRPLSAEGIAAEVASHVNHFSTNPNLPLPPVEPSKRLLSSPGPLNTGFDQSQSDISGRPSKKPRRGTVVGDTPVQTATPPPSAHKGSGRKLAPKLDASAMQNEQGFGEADFTGAPQQSNINAFTAPGDLFSYPLSAPAAASVFTDQRPFWDTDASMANMSIDFSAAGAADMFATATPHHRQMGSVDWGTANQIFQETGIVPEGGSQENGPVTTRQGRPLAPKTLMPNFHAAPSNEAMFAGNYPTPVDDPFGMVGNAGAVDPGLLFSQPQSSGLNTVSFSDPMAPPNQSVLLDAETSRPSSGPVSIAPKAPIPAELGRSASLKGKGAGAGAGRKKDRASASSPIKPTGRPGLSRSLSESRGKRPISRATLPTLVPAPRPQSQEQPIVHQPGQFGRPIVKQPNKPSGRTSPLKNQHQRLPSLSSIPETAGPRTRTHAEFTIDANGRASVETMVIVDDEAPIIRKTHSSQSMARHRRWNSPEDDDESSTDDEPIIIPSRNTSFALPDPHKPIGTHPFHASQHSLSERSTTSFATFRASSHDDGDSEAETVLDGRTAANKSLGDAASELRKLRDSRQKQAAAAAGANSKQRRYTTGPTMTAGFASSYAGHDLVSPTTLTDATCLPTPSTDSKGYGVRCVCNRPEVDRGSNDFMVQCESCEMWLHGSCININRRAMPSVYICAFCANTPNAHGSRRDSGRVGGTMLPPNSATSPLARKSFKSFR